jgi:hypothetical protein
VCDSLPYNPVSLTQSRRRMTHIAQQPRSCRRKRLYPTQTRRPRDRRRVGESIGQTWTMVRGRRRSGTC